MTDRGGGASLLPYTPAGVTGSDDDDDTGSRHFDPFSTEKELNSR